MKTLRLSSKLKSSPQAPKYKKTVKDISGKDVICACPDANRALLAIMDMHAVNGGAACHWGGPAAITEVMSALHSLMFQKKNWFDHYHFVNDIGHAENGIYALRANWGYDDLKIEDLWKFRSIESKLTGHGESHLNPEGVLLSNGPLSSSVAQAQGLAMADKISGSERLTFCVMSDGAAMEGEAKEAFAAIAGLTQKNQINPFILIVSDNNTKLSGRIDEDSYSMVPTFNSLEALGWETKIIAEGNNLEMAYQVLEESIQRAQAGIKKPLALIFKTVKGYGVKSTQESKSGGHGYPLKAYSHDLLPFVDEIFHQQTPPEFKQWANEAIEKKQSSSSESKASSIKTEKAQAGLARGAVKASQEGYPVFSLSSDLQGSTGMADFQKQMPERFIDLGIAESNMVSAAAGFSKAGFIPIVDTFTAFGVTKGNLPFIMASLSQAPIIAVFSHAGFQDAADGASHQSLTYFAAMGAIPGVNLIQISCAAEGEALMYQAITEIAKKREAGHEAQSYIFFVGRENYPTHLNEKTQYQLGHNTLVKEGTDLSIISAGPLLYKAIAAAEKLQAEGISVSVINQSHVNYFNVAEVIDMVKKSGNKLLTVEDHQVIGGLGAQLIHAFHRHGYHQFVANSLGVKGEFGQSAYKADELYQKHGLDEQGIITAVKKLL